MYLGGELLQTADVDGALLRGVEVTASGTEVGRRTDHSAAQAERIVREYGARRAVVVLHYSITGLAEWLACWTQALKGPGSNRSRDTVG